ncbi:MAG: altronate dehydratase [Anaerolineaceae bacterium]|nr:MAG: altronate dehydratase [Anaerolineaceae bacterium]
MQEAIKINKYDNVAVALKSLSQGQVIIIEDNNITLLEDIPAGHKFALEDIDQGSEVIKYGYPIGNLSAKVAMGEWVHTHNLVTGLKEVKDYTYDSVETVSDDITSQKKDFFMGYKRKSGKVGIRNEVWIIPTVGCVNDIGRLLAAESKRFITDEVDDIIAYAHPYGCSQLGDDHKNTQKILSGLINHPNGAGVLVLGLGCENNHIDELKKCIGDYDEDRVKFLVCQEYDDEIKQGLNLIEELVMYSSGFKREQIPVSELVVGLKCGGSDGYSGITANPTVGGFSDLLIKAGGTSILTEVPEMFGAETILMNRCANSELFDQTVTLINDFKQYFIDHEQPIFENPSPGNIKGGITTLEEKSLGCTQKSGTALVNGVLNYGELIHNKGLQLLNSPGNDLVASTALAASGAHIILFTTGRGTPFGCPVPTIKISSNSELSNKKKGWIDFDAGKLLEDISLDRLALELYELVLDVASGKKVKNEVNGYRDIAIFKQGVTL